MVKILLYGNDLTLLLTRRLILERQGLPVFTTTHFEEEIELIANQHLDVLILCQTLQMDQRQSALMMARELRPEMKKLVLTDSEVGYDLEVYNGEVLDALDGPQALLTAVNKMLSRQFISGTGLDMRSAG